MVCKNYESPQKVNAVAVIQKKSRISYRTLHQLVPKADFFCHFSP